MSMFSANQCYVNAQAFWDKNKQDEAMDSINQAILLNSNFAVAYYTRAYMHHKRKEYAAADLDFQKAIKFSFDTDKNCLALSHHWLAINHMKRGALDDALTHINKAIQEKKEYLQMHFICRGYILYKQGELNSAISNLNHVIANDPKYAKAFYIRGLIFKALGKIDLAIADFDQAIKMRPKMAKSHYALGEVLKVKGNVLKAAFYHARALEEKPNNESYHHDAVQALHQLFENIHEYEKNHKELFFAFTVLKNGHVIVMESILLSLQNKLNLIKEGDPELNSLLNHITVVKQLITNPEHLIAEDFIYTHDTVEAKYIAKYIKQRSVINQYKNKIEGVVSQENKVENIPEKTIHSTQQILTTLVSTKAPVHHIPIIDFSTPLTATSIPVINVTDTPSLSTRSMFASVSTTVPNIDSAKVTVGRVPVIGL